MAISIRIWHQHADVLPDSLLFGVAKLPLSGSAKELHDTAPVDDDHRIGDGLQDRAKVAFPDSECFFDLLLIVDFDYGTTEMTRAPSVSSRMMLPSARIHWCDCDRPPTRYCMSKMQPVSIERLMA